MNDAQEATEGNAVPHDPAIAGPDPALFAPMTSTENTILGAHLTPGWCRQSAVYRVLSEPWRETAAVINDLSGAWWIAFQAEGEPGAGR